MVVDMNNGTGWPFGGPGVSLEDAATKAIFQHYTVAAGKKFRRADSGERQETTNFCLFGQADGLFR